MASQSTCTQTHRHTHGTTDRTSNLLISSNVHFVYLAQINISIAMVALSPGSLRRSLAAVDHSVQTDPRTPGVIVVNALNAASVISSI